MTVDRLDLVPCGRTDCQKCQAGRAHQRFLGTDHQDVDPPLVRSALHRPDAADSVDDQQCFAFAFAFVLGNHLADSPDVVANAGTRLAKGGVNGRRVRVFLKQFANPGSLKRFAPREFVTDDFDAEPLAEDPPPFGKLARFEHDRLSAARHDARNGRFHPGGAASGDGDDVVLRLKNILQPGDQFGVNRPKFGGAMVGDLSCECKAGQPRGPGSVPAS